MIILYELIQNVSGINRMCPADVSGRMGTGKRKFFSKTLTYYVIDGEIIFMVQAATDRKEATDDRNLTPTSKAPERWNLKSSAFYERLKFLKITPIKEGRKSFLDDEQIAQLNELDEYIQKHGSMEGFNDTNSNSIVKAEENNIQTNNQQSQSTVEAPNYTRNVGSEQQQMAQLIASAQNKAAGVLMAEGKLTQQFIANPHLLSKELLDQIQEANAIPQVDPNAYAAELLRQAAN